jgi:hypothetical protein
MPVGLAARLVAERVNTHRRARPHRGPPASALLACGVALLLTAGLPSARAAEIDLQVPVPSVDVEVEPNLNPNVLIGPQGKVEPEPVPEPVPAPGPALGVQRESAVPRARTSPAPDAPAARGTPGARARPKAFTQEVIEPAHLASARPGTGQGEGAARRQSSRPASKDDGSAGPRGVRESTDRGGHPSSRAARAAPAEPPPRRLPVAVVTAVKALSFPLALALLVAGFLLVQGRLDRRDPKLTLAPLDSKHDLQSFE